MLWEIFRIPSELASFYVVNLNAVENSVLYWLILFAGLIIAISIHEFAHAWSTNILGDNTAKSEGRLTLNPIKHFDLIGILLITFTNFGYGRPVPVNPNRFKNPVQGLMFVSLAGPASNILQALFYTVLFIVLKQLDFSEGILSTFTIALPALGFINIVLAVFNMLPLYPLDGSKIWGYVHPRVQDFLIEKVYPYSLWILLLLIFPLFGTSSILSILLSPIREVYYSILSL